MVPMMVPKKFSGFLKFGVTPGGGVRAGILDKSSFDESIISICLGRRRACSARSCPGDTNTFNNGVFGEISLRRKRNDCKHRGLASDRLSTGRHEEVGRSWSRAVEKVELDSEPVGEILGNAGEESLDECDK